MYPVVDYKVTCSGRFYKIYIIIRNKKSLGLYRVL